jgi:hypothetical protein
MNSFYEKFCTFCILFTVSIFVNILLNIQDTKSLPFRTVIEYSVIILISIIIFWIITFLPIKSTFIIYLVSSTSISSTVIIIECVIFKWLKLTIANGLFICCWIFMCCGFLTIYYIKKNNNDIKKINQQLKKWQ